MWFIGVEVEQETSVPPPKKNPGSAPACAYLISTKESESVSLPMFDLKRAALGSIIVGFTVEVSSKNLIQVDLEILSHSV